LSANGKPGFVCQIPAAVFRDQRLSIEARGFFGLLVAIADAKTGLIPSPKKPNITPEHLQRMAGCSRSIRLRMEAELCNAGLLSIEREMVPRGRRTVYGRKIYRVKTQQISSGQKSAVDAIAAKDCNRNEANDLELPGGIYVH
jgi:hypothetical protein